MFWDQRRGVTSKTPARRLFFTKNPGIAIVLSPSKIRNYELNHTF
jgi:hypothetical protein